MDLAPFEENKALIAYALGEGEGDSIESASEVVETECFRFIKPTAILDKLTETYPSPRKKEEVPCDQDLLRKVAKDTEADALMRWFSTDVAEVLKNQCAFSMVINQVVFIMLSYTLLQRYLLRQGRTELNNETLPHIRQQLSPSDNHIIGYFENDDGLFAPLEFTEIIATLGEEARKKVAGKCRRLRRELNGVMRNPRAP